jgi:hypothetical protein
LQGSASVSATWRGVGGGQGAGRAARPRARAPHQHGNAAAIGPTQPPAISATRAPAPPPPHPGRRVHGRAVAPERRRRVVGLAVAVRREARLPRVGVDVPREYVKVAGVAGGGLHDGGEALDELPGLGVLGGCGRRLLGWGTGRGRRRSDRRPASCRRRKSWSPAANATPPQPLTPNLPTHPPPTPHPHLIIHDDKAGRPPRAQQALDAARERGDEGAQAQLLGADLWRGGGRVWRQA